MQYKQLYKKDSKGKIQSWKIEVKERDGEGYITISSGKLDGRRTSKARIVRSGKNIGKTNQTTPIEQAQAEAQSAWQKKRDKDYYETIEAAENSNSTLPMLAHKYTERGHDIKFPCSVKPKLDGVRCIINKTNNELSFMTRGGKQYDSLLKNEKLCEYLQIFLKNGETIDGELYVHGWSLQRIVSAAKAYKDDTLLLEFWVFDKMSTLHDFSNVARYATLITRFEKFNKLKFVKLVENTVISDKDEIKTFHDVYVQKGYEGVIIRNLSGQYVFGERSKDLQKYKEFMEDEFEIVDTYCESNIINKVTINSICFRCKTKDGEVFETRPKGTLADRETMWNNKDSYIGKMLTVRYQAITDEDQGEGKGVPQFPIGITVRDYE